MATNALLNFCKSQQWNPRYLNATEKHPASAEQISNEAKAALEAGMPDVCLGLIKLAQALELRSVEHLELKAAALRLRQNQPLDADPAANDNGQNNQSLLSDLLDACAARHWSPQFISESLANAAMDELETNVLKEAEAARNNGAVELSLTLMDRTLQHGCPSLWILHNKALALSQLQRFDLAHTLWEELIQHDKVPAFVSVAEEAYRASKQREQLVRSTPLPEALIGRIQQDHLHPQVLPVLGELSEDADLETLILQEAETQRNNDQAQLSVDLLNLALNYGCDSLWLFHNKALGLLKLGQLEAAIAIWNGLSHHQIEGFSNNVQTALGSAEEALLLQRAQEEEASGSLEMAIERLTIALLDDPEQEAVETRLKALLRKRRHGGSTAAEISPLEDHFDELDLNHAFLLQAEERLASTSSQ